MWPLVSAKTRSKAHYDFYLTTYGKDPKRLEVYFSRRKIITSQNVIFLRNYPQSWVSR